MSKVAISSLSPEAAHRMIQAGAVLVDVRNADEHAREHIAQARHIPLDAMGGDGLPVGGGNPVIFHCRSGNRTRTSLARLRGAVAGEAYVLDGGLNAWKKAGLPVVTDKSQPLELGRQVQIAAGSLILLGVVLGAVASPWFYWIPGFIGAGLVFAGLSGFCGLARVLMRMPWNRQG